MTDWDYYKPSKPREAKGGIKAQSRYGFGASWWAKRWIQVLESFHIGARLKRGQSYARSGQVLSIEIDKGMVSASVQGSRSRPYQVKIGMNTLSAREWENLAEVLSREVLFAAKLLAGEMPQDIEQIFGNAGLSLFPTRMRDLHTECSCPDWSNPCKHIAAVYYLLGEEFDRDPFLIFKLRGMGKEELISLIGCSATQPEPEETAEATMDLEPLSFNPASFWGDENQEQETSGAVEIPQVSGAMIRQMGYFPFWRGNENLLQALEAVYRTASQAGLSVLLKSSQRRKN